MTIWEEKKKMEAMSIFSICVNYQVLDAFLFSLYRLIKICTVEGLNLQPLDVVNPSSFSVSAICCSVSPFSTKTLNIATARLLLGLLLALALFVSLLWESASACLSIKCSGLPSVHPLAFFAASACFVRAAVSSASYCAIADMI